MDVRQLRYFLAVVDAGTFTEAANRLHVSQPSLSQTIAALEREVGGKLLIRLPRGVQLSPLGVELVVPARRAVSALQAVSVTASAVNGLTQGTLDFVVAPSLLLNPAGVLVRAFAREYPSLNVRIREGQSSADVTSRILSGDGDVGCVDLRWADERLLTSHLATFELFLAVMPRLIPASAAGIAWGSAIDIKLFEDVPWISPPSGTISHEHLRASGFQDHVTIETDSRESELDLVLSGLGAGLLLTPYAQKASREGAAVFALERGAASRIGLLWRPHEGNPIVSAFTRLAYIDRGPGR